jgi:hypothetical protein
MIRRGVGVAAATQRRLRTVIHPSVGIDHEERPSGVTVFPHDIGRRLRAGLAISVERDDRGAHRHRSSAHEALKRRKLRRRHANLDVVVARTVAP